MANAVYKYALDIPRTEVEVPAQARPLSVGVQDNAPVVWVEQAVELPNHRKFTFQVVPTGRAIPAHSAFLGSFQIDDTDGSVFVGHVFFWE